ncbi:hypothetical protein [Pseudomonas amygdali]|uniref:Uncharacterized protein n=2 Tax=Pseudomonas amygdali pv. lachrymans TaxID=53707 RepID=A0ABR5KTS0_PSEAV|nr:hypothetical protein [Pseudomonas amygdali]AXH59605.1 hypothetical protein PLA107_030745 [Pseudomonas amygdali pv. lachrymans str. M301315]KPC17034.1 Uncharacterized protein AC499_0236 [Pseudomonas amygdali pv. lachrymans]KPC17993.1 Uncharacterized protein AC499_1195 [Pseudomonas amygdali pv. lachrymans]RMT06297.1 hypothetical protein ALP54_03527 [Pseudomonas amygdali pv. lachrymans]
MPRQNEEEALAQRVREAYAKTGDCNPEYEQLFDELSQMRAKNMAQSFRQQRGKPDHSPTPYDR